MDVALAGLPLAAALVVLLGLRRSAAVAGGVGTALALALAAAPGAYQLPAERMGLALTRALMLTFLVAYVVFFGLLLYRLMARGGAIAALSDALAAMPGDRAFRALVLCLPLGAFFEAVSGFGLGIVVVAPLLAGLGIAPARVAVLALLTQNAVPWGALAIGVVVSEELSGLSAEAIGVGCAYLSGLVFPFYGVLALRLAGGRRWVLGLAVGVAMALAAWAGTVVFGVELGMVVGGPAVAVAAVGGMWLARWWSERCGRGASAGGRGGSAGASPRELLPTRPPSGQRRLMAPPGPRSGQLALKLRPGLARAAGPYVLLACLLLVGRLVEPARAWLLSVAVVGAAGVSVPLLYSPGFGLLVAGGAAVAFLRLPARGVAEELAATARPWLRAALALVGFMVLSEVMLQSGMTARLANGAAAALGPGYVLAAPLLGGLSGFLTGSNASGSAMLLPFQLEVAARLGVPALVVAAVQNTAASVFSMASPQRVVLAAAMAGRPEDEPRLIRAALLVALGSAALIAVGEVVWLSWPA